MIYLLLPFAIAAKFEINYSAEELFFTNQLTQILGR